MLTTDNNIINRLSSAKRNIQAKVVFNMGTTKATINYNDDLISIKYDRVSENNKFFGFGVSQKATIKIKDTNKEKSFEKGNSILIYFKTSLDAAYTCISPYLYIDNISRDENTNDITIIAYDKLLKTNDNIVNGSFRNFDNLTINNLLISIVEFLGVKAIAGLDLNELITLFPEVANINGTETLREILDDIAEVTGTIYYIDSNNYLRFKVLNESINGQLTINGDDYFTLKTKSVRVLTGITHITELNYNFTLQKDNGELQVLRENIFLTMNDRVPAALNNIYDKVNNLSITEFNCEWRGNYLLEIGDKITFHTSDDNLYDSYLLNDSFTYNGGLKANSNWSYEPKEKLDTTPATIDEAFKNTYAKVDKVNKEITLLVSEFTATKDEVASLKINTDSIIGSVSSVEKNTTEAITGIKNEITALNSNITQTAENLQIEFNKKVGNIDSVTTSTGFTFDSDGLTVEKSGTEIKTQITENGMQVFKNDEAMLTANNQGVNAANLHATTYLIVGNNSRFEDIGSNRTGCFWIGG